MEGDGPLNGTARSRWAPWSWAHDLRGRGRDLLPADGTAGGTRSLICCSDNMKKLGRLKEKEITQLGETIAKLAQPFQRPPRFDALLVLESA